MKRILSLFLALLMCMSTFSFVSAQENIVFPDIPEDHPQYDSIYKLVSAGIISGFEDGTFRPNEGLTRAQMCKVLNLAFGYTEKSEEGFPDVDESKWYYEYALVAKKAGYIKGYEDGSFRGDRLVTKQEFCTIISRIMGLYLLPIEIEVKDEISDWAYNDVMAVLTNYLMTVDEDGNFGATLPLPRYEMAKTVSNFVEDEPEDDTQSGETSGGTSGGIGGIVGDPVIEKVKYYVYHYLQGANDDLYYIEKKEEFTDEVGKEVTAQSIAITGATYDENDSQNIKSATLKKDEELVLKLYYKRNTVNITYDNEGSKTILPYRYGAKVTLPKNPSRQGYSFDGWYEDTSDVSTKLTSETVIKSDITVYASWKANDGIEYRIEHYKAALGAGYILADTEYRGDGKTGETVYALANTYEGFTVNNSKSAFSGTVLANGTLVLKIYYERNKYTVTYMAGDEPVATKSVAYEEIIPTNVTATAPFTYEFSCWTATKNDPSTRISAQDKVMGDVTVHAYFTERSDKYIIDALLVLQAQVPGIRFKSEQDDLMEIVMAAVGFVIDDAKAGVTVTKQYVKTAYGTGEDSYIRRAKKMYNGWTGEQQGDFERRLLNGVDPGAADILLDYFVYQ